MIGENAVIEFTPIKPLLWERVVKQLNTGRGSCRHFRIISNYDSGWVLIIVLQQILQVEKTHVK